MFLLWISALLCKIAALRSFALEKLQYWRESGSGISSLAYFLSKDTIDLFNIIIKPVVYLSMFYFFNNPRSSFSDNYIVLMCLVYCVTGIAYMLAIFLEPGPAQLVSDSSSLLIQEYSLLFFLFPLFTDKPSSLQCSVLLPVVLTLIATRTGEGKVLKSLANLCYSKWALEAFVIANAER